MKRIATPILAAALTGGAIAWAPAVFAETTIYGSVRSGIIYQGSEGSTKATWDLGSSDSADLDNDAGIGPGKDKLWSRIGVKASHDLGNGMTGGLHIEKRLDSFRTRHQNVWLSGAFGKVTLGQQGTVYHPAASWDGTYLFGGNSSFDTSRDQGVKYSSALEGPFSFSAMISDDNSSGGGQGGGLDQYELSATFSMADVASVNLGYLGQDDGGADYYGGTVGGSVGGVSWEVGYERSSEDNDRTHYGGFLSYAFSSNSIYAYYEDLNTENNAGENHHVLLGYSRSLGTNTRLIFEHLRPDTGRNKTALALRVDF